MNPEVYRASIGATGSAVTSVELLSPRFGDALIDLHAQRGVGFDQCTITDVEVTGDTISFPHLFFSARNGSSSSSSAASTQNASIKSSGTETSSIRVTGAELLKNGRLVGPLK